MRVLRLLVDEHHHIELHPTLTVVTGLDGSQRGAVRRAMTAVGTGLAPATTGLFEVQGVLFDLDQPDLDLLDVADHPGNVVVSPATVPGTADETDAERLRVAEAEVIDRAADRRRAALALAAAERRAAAAEDGSGVDPPTALVARARRAELLRRAIGLHRATDPEPVRSALDRRRDAARLVAAGASSRPPEPPPGEADDHELRIALAGVGLDVRGLDLPGEEVVRIAEDWLDERQRDVAWAVGATVELQGLDASLERSRADGLDAGLATDPVLELARRRSAAEWATRAHAAAIDHADETRAAIRAVRQLPAKELEWHLLARLAEHRRDRLAGAVPLVLDALFDHLDDADLAPLLDRVARMAGSVQVVSLGDDARVVRWAGAADERRTAVVSPTPISSGGIWS